MESIRGLHIFRPGNFSEWSIKLDGINVQMIRVGQFIYFLTAKGMVLHLVLPVNMFGYKAWPDGESVRAELTLSCESDDNYDCFRATINEFITRNPRPWTDMHDLSRKNPLFCRMDETAQWNASGNNRRIHLHVFGMDHRIPDDTIVKMIQEGGPHITAVKWTPVTSESKLLSILRSEWNKGGEGLILRTVSRPVNDFGSRPSSVDAAADAGAYCPEQTVNFAKCKIVYTGMGQVVNAYRSQHGLYIHRVRVQPAPHIDGGVIKVGLGHTSSWRVGLTVQFYVIPQSHKCNTARWFVGLKFERKQDSPPHRTRSAIYLYIYVYKCIYVHI